MRVDYDKCCQCGTSVVTGELLIQQLERRLDSVAFRLGFAISRRQARQVVRHGHVEVNGRKVNIPSYQVSVGDEIRVREGSKALPVFEVARRNWTADRALHRLGCAIDRPKFVAAKCWSLPKREDVHLPVNEQLIVELYSK